MKKQRSSLKNIISTPVTTKIGALVLCIIGLPIILLAAMQVQSGQQHAQMVQGDSFAASTGYAHSTTINGGIPDQMKSLPTPPAGCYFQRIGVPCAQGVTCAPIPPILVCPSITPPHPSCVPLLCPPGKLCPNDFGCRPFPSISFPPRPSCIPRPPCLSATPRCLITEPNGIWCPPTITPSVQPTGSITPPPFPSCIPFPKPTCNPLLGIACRAFPPCFTSITPQPTCFPRPACLDATPRCLIPEPKFGWCAPSPTPSTTPIATQSHTTNSGVPSLFVYFNSFLRGLLGRSQ